MLDVRGLTKIYLHRPAVDNVSFRTDRYEVCGYLGPNGSGKTTTVNMIVGLLQPTVGHIFFDGADIREDPVAYKRRIGYVPEVPYLYTYLTGREYLQLAGRLRGMNARIMERKIDDLLHLFSMYEHRHTAISSYSKGMKQKILVAAAVMHNPDLLVFDEPLSGLDVTSSLVFRNLVKSLAQQGKVILYSSHVLEVVEKICTKVVILHQGRIAANDSVEHLRSLMQLPSLEDIFAELVHQEDTEKIASEIVEVINA